MSEKGSLDIGEPLPPLLQQAMPIAGPGCLADESHRIAGETAMDETDIDAMLARADRDDPMT